MSELPADVVVVDGEQYPALEGELILAKREIERLRAGRETILADNARFNRENEELTAELREANAAFAEADRKQNAELGWWHMLEGKLTKHQWYYDYMEENPKPGAGT